MLQNGQKKKNENLKKAMQICLLEKKTAALILLELKEK